MNSERRTEPTDPTVVTKKDLHAEKYFPLSIIDGGPGVSREQRRGSAHGSDATWGASESSPFHTGDGRLPEG